MKKFASLCFALASTATIADEGMWQPHQLPTIAEKLVDAGLDSSAIITVFSRLGLGKSVAVRMILNH